MAASKIMFHHITREMKIAEEILQKFVTVAENLKLKHFLVDGTCLGMVREHGFIDGDDDIDVAILSSNGEDCSDLELQEFDEMMKEQGFEIADTNVEHCYKFCHYPFKNGYILLGVKAGNFSESIKPYLKSFENIFYKGKEYYVPYPVEEYLKFCYGEDWKIKKSWVKSKGC